jgi:hypothetical protein
MLDLKLFSIYTLCLQEKNYFFYIKFETFSIYILYSFEKIRKNYVF